MIRILTRTAAGRAFYSLGKERPGAKLRQRREGGAEGDFDI